MRAIKLQALKQGHSSTRLYATELVARLAVK